MKKFFLGLTLGLTAGGVAGFFIGKRYCMKLAEKYIDEKLYTPTQDNRDEVIKLEGENPLIAVTEEKVEIKDETSRTSVHAELEFIEEKEFGDDPNYDQKFLILYADKVLVYDKEETPIVEHEVTDWHLPRGWLDKILESDEGLIWCADNIHKEYYQIMKSQWTYMESRKLVEYDGKHDNNRVSRDFRLGDMEDITDDDIS